MWPLREIRDIDAPSTIALLGDSHTAQDGNRTTDNGFSLGFFNAGNMLLNGRFSLRAVLSTSGATIETIATDYLSTALACNTKYYHVLAGANNLGAGETGSATFTKLVNLLVTPLLNTGAVVFVGTTIAGTGIPNKYEQAVLNMAIRKLPETYPRVIVVDYDKYTVDPITGVWRTGLTSDGAHANNSGVIYLGTAFYDCASQIFGDTPPKYISGSNYDAYEYLANPRVKGNNASGTNKFAVAAGVTGTGPGSLNISRSGTATATCTGDNARQDKYSGGAFNVVCSFVADSDSILITPGVQGNAYFSRTWAAATARGIGEYNNPTVPNAFLYRAVSISGTGTSGGVEPTLPTTLGATVADNPGANQIIWQCIRKPVAGDRFISEVYFSFSAVSGQIAMRYSIGFEDITSSGTLRPLYEMNNTTVASQSTGINASLPSTFSDLFDAAMIPLNRIMSLKTPIIQFPANCTQLFPTFRIYGTAGSSCTVSYHGASMRYID
jgi:hypothetical protein